MDLRPKKFYSPGYNLIFDIITIPSETSFILIDEFVDACNIPYLLFAGLSLRDSSLLLVHPGFALDASSNSLLSRILSMRRECGLSACQECREFPKKPSKTRKAKKKLHVTTLKMNSLHMTCRVMNSRYIDFTCRCHFTLDITNPAFIPP